MNKLLFNHTGSQWPRQACRTG